MVLQAHGRHAALCVREQRRLVREFDSVRMFLTALVLFGEDLF